MKICFITAECVGPFRNGGIGTSTTGLAVALAAAGHEVTLFYTRGIHLFRRQVSHWRKVYRKAGINFIALGHTGLSRYAGPLAAIGYIVPCAVLDFLSDNEFDIVHVNDTDAEGFLVLAAHRYTGLLPAARFVLGLHSPREWVYAHNRVTALVPVDATMHFTERLSVSLADQIWSPSRYLLDWLNDAGWALPDDAVCQQYVMPSRNFSQGNEPAALPVQEGKIEKLVFFGRLEERKGLRLFLDAVDSLHAELEQRRIGVVFLGRSVKMDGMSSRAFIARRAKNWSLPWKIISSYGQDQALDFLARQHCLAVIASAADNSPCTVYEAIEAGIPFIAAASGGIPELIHEQDLADTLFEYNPDSLKALLLRRLDVQPKIVQPRITREKNIAVWLARHEELYSQPQPVTGTNTGFDTAEKTVFIAVVEVRTGDRTLEKTIQNLLASDRPPDRVLVLSAKNLDDGHYPPEVLFAGPAVFENQLADLLGKSQEAAVYFLYSGVRVTPSALRELAACLYKSNVEGLMPSATLDGRCRVDVPGGDIASVFLYGPACSGMTVLTGQAVLRAMKCNGDGRAGPFYALLDRAVIGSQKIHPYPAATPDILVDSLPSVPMTVQRIELYARAEGENIKMLTMLAAGLAGAGKGKALLRYWGYRLLRSRFGFLFAPISAMQKLFGK